MKRTTSKGRRLKHGHARVSERGILSPTYRSWLSMKNRVKHSHKKVKYDYYSGVEVHQEWFDNFEVFLRDVGERPKGCSLDRIDGTKGYIPGNVRWADAKTQGANRACVRPITFNGRTQNAEDWAKELGIRPGTLRSRIDRGWPIADVFNHPPKRGHPRV